MPQASILKARGLYTFPNAFSELPEGSLIEATNVVIDREGVISPRRGYALYGTAMGSTTTRAKQILTYKGRILRHYGTTLGYDGDGAGTFGTFSGSFSEVETGIRIKGVEVNGNYYFTTSAGIKKISVASAAGLASASVTAAGGVKALDGIARLNSDTGFFLQDSVIAYRIVWGIKDANNNLILGYPSESIVITNPITSLLANDYNNLLAKLDIASAADGADALGGTSYIALRISTNADATAIYNALKALCQAIDTDLGVTDFWNGGATTGSAVYAQHTTEPSIDPTSAELLDLQAFFDGIVNSLLAQPGAKISSTAQDAASFSNSTQSATVDLTFTVPSDVTTNHLYQIYRTALTTSDGANRLSDLSPGDECQLVYEANPTSGEITAKSITVHDITPESFRGANLYTNPNSGEGIAQANEIPPLSKDIAVFKNSTFYANTQTKHRLSISLLSGTNLEGRTFTVTLGATTHTYTFVTPVAQICTVSCVAGSNYVTSGTADYFDVYSAEDRTGYRVWFNVSGGTMVAPSAGALTLVQVDILGADTNAQVATKLSNKLATLADFAVSVSTNVVTITNEAVGVTSPISEHVTDAGFTVATSTVGVGEDALSRKVAVSQAATPSQVVDETARSLIRVINKQADEVINGFYVSGPSDVPGAMLFETRSLGTNAFTITGSDSTIGAAFNPDITTAQSSDNEVAPNRIFYSKTYQPEAVPLVNFQDIGAKDKKIIRILPLRDSLFILKEDGIYRLSGDTTTNFQITLFDSSTLLIASDTATVLNNQIYMVSTQGVATISDTGVSVVSRPIENLLIHLPLHTNFKTASWAVAYESDRALLIFTTSASSDTTATQCFRYNTFTSTWTILDLSKTCGAVNNGDDLLYLGASDTNYIEKERKTFDRRDHADRQSTLVMPLHGIAGKTLQLGGIFGIEVGDVIVQTQYLTLSKFNRLLKKLDSDTGVADNDYYLTLFASAGDSLSDKLALLAAKLNADTGVTANDFTATPGASPATTQAEFNTIIGKLNVDTGVTFTNYTQSTGSIDWEAIVTGIDNSIHTIGIDYEAPFVQGDFVLYKHFQCEVVWAPYAFGDPSLTKHVREGTILFENNAFTSAMASYASDLNTSFTDITFEGEGAGTYGSGTWGRSVWGGEGTAKPFRTFIPRNQQRCRYMNCRFRHSSAMQKFSIFGISYTFETIASRGWR